MMPLSRKLLIFLSQLFDLTLSVFDQFIPFFFPVSSGPFKNSNKDRM